MEKGKCTLCGDGSQSFKWTKSLKRHMKDKHANQPGLDEALQAVPVSPKKRCKACGKLVGNVHQHRLACKPRAEAKPEDFVQAFRDRLASIKGGRCAGTTRDTYVTQLQKFLRFETSKNANFSPWDWLRWDERRNSGRLRDHCLQQAL